MSIRIMVRPHLYKEIHFNQLPWREGGYQIPEDRADEPFTWELGPTDENRHIDDLMLEIIQEAACDEPEEYLNIYHFSVGGFRIRPDAMGSILREGDEVQVLYEVRLPEYDY